MSNEYCDPLAEFIFHGTGTSGSVPVIDCLTAPEGTLPCRTCISTLRPEGKKNIRRNTGAILRVTCPSAERGKVTIVIDVGKNFLASALEWFPKYGLRRIDAVLITHAHADAMNGLDDLRGWTLGNAIQSHIDIYLSEATLTQVKRAFPYLVSKEFASGGGDVPQFRWHTIEANCSFMVGDSGVEVTPISVHHGRLFSTDLSPPAWVPTPVSTNPSTPRVPSPTPVPNASGIQTVVHPYTCFGFIMLDIVYLSDVSYIPEETWTTIQAVRKRPYTLFVVDCLRPKPHTSHYGLAQAVAAARQLGGEKLHTYLVGFGHELPHTTWMAIGESLGCPNVVESDEVDIIVRSALSLVEKGPPVWVRPAHDGLRLYLTEHGGEWKEDTTDSSRVWY